jgi:HEAT repeat protein
MTTSDLRSSDARARERALSTLPKGAESTRAVVHLLRDPDPFVRNAALERIHGWDARQALPLIVPSLRDPYEIARVTALECVASWGGLTHRRFVRPLLTDRSPLVRAYAAWTLGELGGAGLQKELQQRLMLERHPIPRAALHEVLFGLTRDVRHLKALLRGLSSVNHRVACFAARSLSNCLTVDNSVALTAALKRAHKFDKRLGVRETALKALEDIESRTP